MSHTYTGFDKREGNAEEKKIAFEVVLGQLESHTQTNQKQQQQKNLGSILVISIKVNSKSQSYKIENVKAETTKLPEENLEKKLCGLGLTAYQRLLRADTKSMTCKRTNHKSRSLQVNTSAL